MSCENTTKPSNLPAWQRTITWQLNQAREHVLEEEYEAARQMLDLAARQMLDLAVYLATDVTSYASTAIAKGEDQLRVEEACHWARWLHNAWAAFERMHPRAPWPNTTPTNQDPANPAPLTADRPP